MTSRRSYESCVAQKNELQRREDATRSRRPYCGVGRRQPPNLSALNKGTTIPSSLFSPSLGGQQHRLFRHPSHRHNTGEIADQLFGQTEFSGLRAQNTSGAIFLSRRDRRCCLHRPYPTGQGIAPSCALCSALNVDMPSSFTTASA